MLFAAGKEILDNIMNGPGYFIFVLQLCNILSN